MTLRGRKVVLRSLTRDDFPQLLEILRDPEVRAWWGDHDDARLAKDYLSEDGDTGLTILHDGEIAGMIGYWEENEPDYRHAGMDIFVGPAHFGDGVAQDALRTLARHLIEERGHHRLVIDPAASNERAIRAYEKLGFRRVGVTRRSERSPDGVWRDGLLMDLLADELPA